MFLCKYLWDAPVALPLIQSCLRFFKCKSNKKNITTLTGILNSMCSLAHHSKYLLDVCLRGPCNVILLMTTGDRRSCQEERVHKHSIHEYHYNKNNFTNNFQDNQLWKLSLGFVYAPQMEDDLNSCDFFVICIQVQVVLAFYRHILYFKNKFLEWKKGSPATWSTSKWGYTPWILALLPLPNLISFDTWLEVGTFILILCMEMRENLQTEHAVLYSTIHLS